MPVSLEERIFIAVTYFTTRSFQECRDRFVTKFPNRPVPSKSSVFRIAKKFLKTGSVKNEKHRRSPTVLTEEKMMEVQEKISTSPMTSLSKLKQECDLSYSSTFRAMKKLKMRAYKIHMMHALKEPDFEARIRYCRWFKQFVGENIDILDNCFFSDEAWFHLDGFTNSQNTRTWNTENPYLFFERPLHSKKIGVWCAMSRQRIVGPFFFEGTVTAEVYQGIMQDFVSQLTNEERYCWFQQDGATAHTARSTMAILEEFFGDRIISRGLWPPRSPDLSPLDFFLWGAMKNKIYANKPTTLNDLRQNIESYISRVSKDTLRNVADNTLKRVEACLQESGGHFQHLL